MKTSEEILRTYLDFGDSNIGEMAELLHLTIIDAMEEYAAQFKSVTDEDLADVRLPLPSVNKIEADIKSCYEKEGSGCGQWCGSEECSNDGCANYSEYDVLNRQKLEKVIEGWRNEA